MDRPAEEGTLLWTPSAQLVAGCHLTRFAAGSALGWGGEPPDYERLWRWSVDEPEAFWAAVWDHFEISSASPYSQVIDGGSMPATKWFAGSRLNYAEHALRGWEDRLAVLGFSEARPPQRLSGLELRALVGGVAKWLRAQGVSKGDRVAAYLPNVPEAVIACLATTSIGAVWTSCSPDFGERAVLDRLEQVEPKVLFAADGYVYGGKVFDRRPAVARLAERMSSLQVCVLIPVLGLPADAQSPTTVAWEEVAQPAAEIAFEPVAFDHPLWVLYSSGTTGLPKAIVHGHGGMLLEQYKALALHSDLGPRDRSFWFTTTGWMMWNHLLGSLLVGAAVILYDGSPVHPGPDRLWQLAAEARVTHFGTSAGHLAGCAKAGIRPAEQFDLQALRFIGSTGSPLSPEGFAWVYRSVRQDVWLASVSGGTDVCTAFVLGCPWLPVRAGVIQCRGLGVAVEAFDAAGKPVRDQVGELVLTAPMPSMPVSFWGDPDGRRYRSSYFETFPGVWRHGDWIKVRSDGGVVIYGRSDSTINRHGVRIGTSEIYRAVEEMEEVVEALAVDVGSSDGESRLWLFLVLQPGMGLSAGLEAAIRQRLREQVSPRHVPDFIYALASIPKTLSGKKLEVPVKKILSGAAPESVISVEALQDPAALTPFVRLSRNESAQS